MLNRAQRRAYEKRIKKDPLASLCPVCNHKSRFYTDTDINNNTIIKCEYCNATVREGKEITDSLPPNILLPNKLEIIEKWLDAKVTTKNIDAIVDNLPKSEIKGEEIK